MNKYFYLLPMLSLPLQALTVETRATHGVFYAGVEKQACLQIKVDADAADVGKKITSFSFTTGKTSKAADITMARLYKSTENVFTLNTGDDNRRAVELATGSASSGKVTFATDISIESAGTSYYWLTYDIGSKAKGDNKIDGVCSAVKVGGSDVKPEARMGTYVKKRVYGTVYPFKNRIVPYYRTQWINEWNPNQLNSTHFKSFTDIIHFGYSFTQDGRVDNQWYNNGVEMMAYAKAAREKLKTLRGSAKSRIIAGFGHFHSETNKPFKWFYEGNQDREARKKIAQNTAKYLLDSGYDGIDLDWEYPDNLGEWIYMTQFIADLREELAGSGLSVSMASTLSTSQPWHEVTDQLDFINTMSYDLWVNNATQHSPMWLLQNDASTCHNTLKMPKSKIVLGLPFYTNQYGCLWDQVGWNSVVNAYPNLSPSVNTALMTTGNGTSMHSFNGVNLIKEKCKWVKDNGYGGVMIWAYDTDVQLTHKMSLGKAMYSVIKQTKR